MSIFNGYLEEIKLSGKSEPLDCSAYRLDYTGSNGNFRADAGVGTCNCCDYFAFDRCGNLILIEDTQLDATINDRLKAIENEKDEFSFLKTASKEMKLRYVVNYIVSENVTKVYGSLFVFYIYKFLNMNLDRVHEDFFRNMGSLKFWLVTVNVKPKESISSENYRLQIKRSLRGKLGKKFVMEVEVIPENRLRDKLALLGSISRDMETSIIGS